MTLTCLGLLEVKRAKDKRGPRLWQFPNQLLRTQLLH
eukprot:CAMPEP_0181380364 /NCGR_PEP_ID=MMETSP1106-20121128/19505_1 /TAXON_ID=81844 /ORGANISM="Mantoniella antarctica, Strain SL-175" /LENGTH=36 /DNA_ID= /DNA_START= /DNA_END= /DNA_ORIENTATION=